MRSLFSTTHSLTDSNLDLMLVDSAIFFSYIWLKFSSKKAKKDTLSCSRIYVIVLGGKGEDKEEADFATGSKTVGGQLPASS